MLKFISNIREIFTSKNTSCSILCSSTEKVVKTPFLGMMFGAFIKFIDNFRAFFVVSAPCAFLLTLLAFAFGFSQSCYFSNYFSYCSDSNILFIIYQIAKMLIISYFMLAYFQLAYKNTKTPIFSKQLVKIIMFNIFSIVVCLCPVFSLYQLIERVPNPNWKIEISYFAVMFLGFLTPFFLMKVYSILAFIASGEKVPSLKNIWDHSSGNTMKIILGFSLIIIFMISSSNALISYYQYNTSNLFDSICFEFILSLLILIFVALLCSISNLHKEYLYKEEYNAKK